MSGRNKTILLLGSTWSRVNKRSVLHHDPTSLEGGVQPHLYFHLQLVFTFPFLTSYLTSSE